MNLSRPFIERPVATTLLAAGLFFAGLLGFLALPVAPLPRVDFPTISISASLPGASPETMASAVATPLERRLGRIAGVTEITSSSTLGQTQITLQFDLDRNVDAAGRDVQAAIAAAAGELPPGLPTRPIFRKINPSDSPIIVLSLTSRTVPLAEIYERANTVLAQKIAQVQGVGQVTVGGGERPAVRVRIDPVALAGSGLSYENVRAALDSATSASPKGALSSPTLARAVEANDQLSRARDYESLVLRQSNGGTVQLRDVARVEDGIENERTAAWETGERAVLVIVRRQPGANILATNARVRALFPSLVAAMPAGVDMHVTIDRTQTIEASVHEVERALGLAILLVVGVVFVFLRSVRAAAIPSVAVPLSLVGTFAFMDLLGYSIDNLSLMALTISTGFVVDDAIVVAENIQRWIEEGHPVREAALAGAKQIGFTIVSITLSLLAVFTPILFMGGMVGRLFRELAVTLAIAIALSAVLSLTLTPMMSSRLLRSERDVRHGRLYRASERAFERVLGAYDRSLGWALDHRRVVELIVLATVGVVVALFVWLPKGLFPQQDSGLLLGFGQAPQDISFPAMKARTEQLNAVVARDPDVDRFVSFIGGGGPGGTTNTGTFFIGLKPKPERKASADEVIGHLRRELSRVQGVTLYLQAVQDMRVGGRFSRTQYQYTLQSADLGQLRAYAPRMLAALRAVPILRDVASDQQTSGLELALDVDRDVAARVGLSMQNVDDTLYDAYGQRQVTLIYSPLDQYHVVLDVDPRYQDPAWIDKMYFGAPGGLVPLGAIAKKETRKTPLAVTHQGQLPSVTLSFNLAPGRSLGEAVSAIQRAESQVRLPASVHGAFAGTAEVFTSSLSSEPLLILFALVCVYVVLGVLYESWVHPVTILSTLPSAGVGALVALLVTGTELTVIALIGIILLIGIVKKNAIMMVDFAIEAERTRGLSAREAIHLASLRRFRPILMTTLAALFGALPLVLEGGMGYELRRPLGLAIIGGLIASQMLTLFTTPVIYLSMDRGRTPSVSTGGVG